MKKVNVYQMEHKVVDVPDGKMYWERLEKQKLPEVTKVMGANVNPRETIKIIQLPIRTHVTRHESFPPFAEDDVTEYFHFAIDDKVQDLIDKLISVAKNNFEREICELKQKFYQGMADKTNALNHQKLRISAFNDLPWYSKLCRLLTNKRI